MNADLPSGRSVRRAAIGCTLLVLGCLAIAATIQICRALPSMARRLTPDDLVRTVVPAFVVWLIQHPAVPIAFELALSVVLLVAGSYLLGWVGSRPRSGKEG